MFLRLRIVAGRALVGYRPAGRPTCTADRQGGAAVCARRGRTGGTGLLRAAGAAAQPFRYAHSMPQSRPTPLPDHATYDALLHLLGHLRDAYTVLQSDELVKVVDFGDVTRKMLAFGLTQDLERVVSALVRHFPAKQYGEMRRAVEKDMEA
jgi:hypothetical protein